MDIPSVYQNNPFRKRKFLACLNDQLGAAVNHEANAARIVECVNAFAGIENPKKHIERAARIEAEFNEAMSFIFDFKKDYERGLSGEKCSPEEMYQQACDLKSKFIDQYVSSEKQTDANT